MAYGCPGWSGSSLDARLVAMDPSFLHADSEDADQSGRMPRLIWVFARRTWHFVGFVIRWLKWSPGSAKIQDRSLTTLSKVEKNVKNKMSLVTRKPVFWVFEQVRLKPACAGIEASYRFEISDIETRDIVLSRQRTTKVLIRLRGCAGWYAPLLFAYGENRFSHDVAHKCRHIRRWTAKQPTSSLFNATQS